MRKKVILVLIIFIIMVSSIITINAFRTTSQNLNYTTEDSDYGVNNVKEALD